VERFEVAGSTVLRLTNPVATAVVVKCPFFINPGMELSPEQWNHIEQRMSSVVKYLVCEGLVTPKTPIETFFV